ncbi:MAG TPA: LysM peptidoglycan-binding domain-containing protein [Longimicrobium sp.]|nr:LysM peptidoglycan-binding domain-containing protein [Longimicrobium sp.]
MRRSASLFAAAGLLLAAAPLAAQDPQPEPRIHVVQEGETLWDIARHYLNDPFLWPEIYRLNTDVVEDPARIYPSERLVIPGVGAEIETVSFGPQRQEGPGNRLQLGTTAPRTAVTSGDFYAASYVAHDSEVQPVGLLVAPELESPVDTRMEPQLNLYARVFVRVEPGTVKVGDQLHFLRRGRAVGRSGHVYHPTGAGNVVSLDGETATVEIVGMFDQVRLNDLALPLARFPLVAGVMPREVQSDVQGRILDFELPRPMPMTESILFLDIGRNAGVSIGDVFEAYTPRGERDWGTRPEVRVARMQVVRVTDGTASVRVTALEQPSIAVGLPVRRVAAMP